jgi:hypothetical protein
LTNEWCVERKRLLIVLSAEGGIGTENSWSAGRNYHARSEDKYLQLTYRRNIENPRVRSCGLKKASANSDGNKTKAGQKGDTNSPGDPFSLLKSSLASPQLRVELQYSSCNLHSSTTIRSYPLSVAVVFKWH